MATNLKTDYKDYIPPESGKRYIITTDAQGYSTIEDATGYTQEGDTFGAIDINTTNHTINTLTAEDVGAVTQTVYHLTPQNGWTLFNEYSISCLVVTGKVATLIARLKAPSATIDSSNNTPLTFPNGITSSKVFDCIALCDGVKQAKSLQIGKSIIMANGSYSTSYAYSIDASFLIN